MRRDEAGAGVEAAVQERTRQNTLCGIEDPRVEDRHKGDANQDQECEEDQRRQGRKPMHVPEIDECQQQVPQRPNNAEYESRDRRRVAKLQARQGDPAPFGATIRCEMLKSDLVHPVIWPIYGLYGDFADYARPLRTSPSRPVAVRLQYFSIGDLPLPDRARSIQQRRASLGKWCHIVEGYSQH
jgi:hypothetical protein